MRRLLGLALLVVACSSEGGGTSTFQNTAGASGAVLAEAGETNSSGGSDGAGATTTAGTNATGAQAGEASGATAGTAPVEAGTGGIAAAGASGGGTGGTQAAGTGGSDSAGQDHGGAGETAGGEAGSGPTEPDPCAGAIHWDKSEVWATYETGVLRHFAGKLWECQADDHCRYYPGNGEPDGWVAVAVCSSGPVTEGDCQCDEGDCCDGCYFRPSSYFCGEFVRYAECRSINPVATCPGYTRSVSTDHWNLFCSGGSGGGCTRWGAHTKYTGFQCAAGSVCVEDGDQAYCRSCPN